jgi:hypothetical protein
MDVNWCVIVGVKEKPESFVFENGRHRAIVSSRKDRRKGRISANAREAAASGSGK